VLALRELALEQAAGSLGDEAYLARMARLREQADAVETQRAHGVPAQRALEWLEALAETWQRANLRSSPT
jgi:hypothetical protein